MPARQEIEEMLEAQAWAKRNGVDEPVYAPVSWEQDAKSKFWSKELHTFEGREFRHCPPDDAYDRLPFVPLSLWPVFLGIVVLFGLTFVWMWNHQ